MSAIGDGEQAGVLVRAQLRGEPIEPPLDLTTALTGLFTRTAKASEPVTHSELEAAGQMRLLD